MLEGKNNKKHLVVLKRTGCKNIKLETKQLMEMLCVKYI